MSNRIITIIGGGAVGVSLLYQLIKKHKIKNDDQGIVIQILEKGSVIGPGLAYREDDPINVLNRPASTMSAIHGDSKDFINWLSSNSKWRAKYPEICLENLEEQFLPRSLFGLYLQSIFDKALRLARSKKIQVNVINDEVINIQPVQNAYSIETTSGQIVISNVIVLSIGQIFSDNYDNLRQSENYLDSPYPTSRLESQIPSEASVAIIGSRLSAIDAAISLKDRGHKGQIAFFSRNGYLPSIRPIGIVDHQLKIFTEKRIRGITDFISLNQIIKLICAEVSLALGRTVELKEWFDRPSNSLGYLENELSNVNSRERILWQSVMIAINKVIGLVWHKLADRDKNIFVKRFRSRWMAYRVGIPIQNAKKIHSLIQSEKLLNVKGLKNITYDKGTKQFIIKCKKDLRKNNFDYVINATGTCTNINYTRSALIRNMNKSGLLKAHVFGGIEIDFDTSKVKDREGNIQNNIYVVGNLTEGEYLFTSVLDLNIAQGNKVSDLIVNELKTKTLSENNETREYYVS